jgi:hypothetical protein
MTGLKFTSRFGLPLKPGPNASLSATRFGPASFFIESSVGRNHIMSFRKREAPKKTMISRYNFICVDWSRSFCS